MRLAASLLVAAGLAVSIAASLTADSTRKPESSSLVILYSSSANGQIRSCNCTKFRFGGYGRQLTLLNDIRRESKNVLLVEGGDSTGGTGFQAELKADVTLKALQMCKYDAVIPGEEELGIRGVRHIDSFDGKSIPMLCANLVSYYDDKPVFPAFKIEKMHSGIRVGVIGLIAESLGGFYLEKDQNYKIADPQESLTSTIEQIKDKVDIAIVIFHGSKDEAKPLCNVEGVDIVLSTHRSDSELVFPQKDSENNVVEAPVEHIGGAVLVDTGTKANWSLGKLEVALNGSKKPSKVKHSLIYLDRRYDEHPEMIKIYNDYNGKVKEAVLKQSREFREQAEALLIKRGIDPDKIRERLRKSPFVTAEKCKDCHEDIHNQWQETRHAKAMQTLIDQHQEFDPECVGCHATGVVARNGYVNLEETPELANVQCEACHGAGLEHTKAPGDKPYGASGESMCRSCHTDERDPEFDFKTAWAKIKH